jgi:hypothetical protein
MKIVTIIGIMLIVLGLLGLVYGGITYTSSKDVVEMGSMHIKVNQTKKLPLSPIAGAVAVAGGVVLVVFGQRRRGSTL